MSLFILLSRLAEVIHPSVYSLIGILCLEKEIWTMSSLTKLYHSWQYGATG